MQRHRALVVEDDEDIADLLSTTLAGAGFDVSIATTGDEAISMIDINPDLVTLDLQLPGMDGVEICRRIRERSDCYVIMLSGRHEEIDRLVGLEVGADDFMAKPFSHRELRARVAALFRRPRQGTWKPPGETGTGADTDRIPGGGGLEILRDRREVLVGETVVNLTRTEFDLLELLASRAGTVIDRASMVEAVWDTEFVDANHLVDVHVANLRRKLKAHSPALWIHTVRGIGYRFDAQG